MPSKKNLVNLDAMIMREDFAFKSEEEQRYEMVLSLSVRDFTQGGMMGPNMRKPDFQRETNHWSPEQVVSLLECFVNGDLIPSVILWQSPTNIFVIDGGHRLSVLRAWIEDDYGDGPTSLMFFNRNIPDLQKKIADKTRKLIEKRVGNFKHIIRTLAQNDITPTEKNRLNTITTRAIPIQWVQGNAEKAESSFFKINTQGTPLDAIEELLLKTRKKPISITARAIIRAGTGHQYWSAFSEAISKNVVEQAREIHNQLFEPEISTPIKTLDMPLGGSKSTRNALKILLDYIHIAVRNQQGEPKKINDQEDDTIGESTLAALMKVSKLTSRITGNEKGSLGLHPVIYFYGPTGHHSSSMFMGTAFLIKQKLLNNDRTFFQQFTSVRENLEKILIDHKALIAMIIQSYVSKKRVASYASFLDSLVKQLQHSTTISDEEFIKFSGLDGKVFVGKTSPQNKEFSDETKSIAFLEKALNSAVKCEICNGYLDPQKSISYDHEDRIREGGGGDSDNCQISHPFCNQSMKN